MAALPPAAPVTGWRITTPLPRDYYVWVDSNDYSVDPAVISRTVEVAAGLEEVTVTCGGRTGQLTRRREFSGLACRVSSSL
jgi:hypothetical protein